MESPGFFDPNGTGDGPGRVVLERFVENGREVFALLEPIGYRDQHHPEPFVVPADAETFRSDLASVPSLFTWLVPRTGIHLPAALLHDGLMAKPGRPRSYRGPQVDRAEADRIFRDAMATLGTSWARRWLIWTAVTLATALTELRPRWRWVPTVVGTVAVIVVLGIVATVDVLGGAEVLPWLGDGPLGHPPLGSVLNACSLPAAGPERVLSRWAVTSGLWARQNEFGPWVVP
ncbi:hypothetical protein BH23ACT2_BH23ACT2_10870 [soil metagenome]